MQSIARSPRSTADSSDPAFEQLSLSPFSLFFVVFVVFLLFCLRYEETSKCEAALAFRNLYERTFLYIMFRFRGFDLMFDDYE